MATFIDYTLTLLMNCFDLYIIHRYMTIFFHNHSMDKKLTFVAYMVRFTLSIFLIIHPIYPLANTGITLASIFFIAFCYHAGSFKKLIATVVIFMCSFISEALVAWAIGIRGFEPLGKIVEGNLFLNIIIEILFWAIALVLAKFKNVGTNIPLPKIFVVAVIVIPASSILLELMIFQQENINHTMVGISLLCILTSNFIMIYLYDSLSKMFQERTQAAIILREKEYYHEQADLLKKNHSELSQFRHDIKNRILVIQQMLADNNVADALKYTRQIAEKLHKTDVYSDTGNIAIDSVINYKLTKAHEMGISVKSNIAIPENLSIDEDDIVVILGNILDNAIEATQQINEDKYINLNFIYDKGSVLLRVKNNYDSFLCLDNDKLLTRKADKHFHGIGLQSVNSVVEKYNGLLEINHNDRDFTVTILLYL